MLQLHLDHLDAVNAAIAGIDKEVDANVEPFRVAIEMLTTIPGVSSLAAEVMVSEIGIDMSRFKTEGHLISSNRCCTAFQFLLEVCLAAHDSESLGGLPKMSNFYCLPG
jgi:Transposase IS116/IS110/IS902 family